MIIITGYTVHPCTTLSQSLSVTFSYSVCKICCCVSNLSFSESSSLLSVAISSCWLEEEALCAISWSQLAKALFLSDVSLSCSCWSRDRSFDHNSFSLERDLHDNNTSEVVYIQNTIIMFMQLGTYSTTVYVHVHVPSIQRSFVHKSSSIMLWI